MRFNQIFIVRELQHITAFLQQWDYVYACVTITTLILRTHELGNKILINFAMTSFGSHNLQRRKFHHDNKVTEMVQDFYLKSKNLTLQ